MSTSREDNVNVSTPLTVNVLPSDTTFEDIYNQLVFKQNNNKSDSIFFPDMNDRMASRYLDQFLVRLSLLYDMPAFQPFICLSIYTLMKPVFGIYPLAAYKNSRLVAEEFDKRMDVLVFFAPNGPVDQTTVLHNADPRIILAHYNWVYIWNENQLAGNSRNQLDSHWFLSEILSAFGDTIWNSRDRPLTKIPMPWERQEERIKILDENREMVSRYVRLYTKGFVPSSRVMRPEIRNHFYCGFCWYVAQPNPITCGKRLCRKYYHLSCLESETFSLEMAALHEVNDIKCTASGCEESIPLKVDDTNLMPRYELVDMFRSCYECTTCGKYHFCETPTDQLKLECRPQNEGNSANGSVEVNAEMRNFLNEEIHKLQNNCQSVAVPNPMAIGFSHSSELEKEMKSLDKDLQTLGADIAKKEKEIQELEERTTEMNTKYNTENLDIEKMIQTFGNQRETKLNSMYIEFKKVLDSFVVKSTTTGQRSVNNGNNRIGNNSVVPSNSEVFRK